MWRSLEPSNSGYVPCAGVSIAAPAPFAQASETAGAPVVVLPKPLP
jgi:hypothetical protein